MAFCPSVCAYEVHFSDGSVKFPYLPGTANVQNVADQYAREVLTPKAGYEVTVDSISSRD